MPSLPPLFPPVEPVPTYIGQMLYIRPNYLVSLSEYCNVERYKSLAFESNKKNLQENATKGFLSRKAVGKMRNAINWMLCSADEKTVYSKKYNSFFKYKVGFVTLTLPDTAKEVTDKVFKEALLNPFLTYMRKFHGLKNYVWKLEFQKNGKLHCHITFDVFIHHAKLRKVWNKILGSNNLLIDFYNKFGHANPNSTDVHSVRKIRNLGAYLAKYMTKNSADLDKINGRIWGCNQEISRANETKVFIDRDATHFELLPLMQNNIRYANIGSTDEKTGQYKRFGEVFFLKYTDWANHLHGQIRASFDSTLINLKNVATSQQQIFEV